jgi:hypothetical protein
VAAGDTPYLRVVHFRMGISPKLQANDLGVGHGFELGPPGRSDKDLALFGQVESIQWSDFPHQFHGVRVGFETDTMGVLLRCGKP